MLTDTEYLEQTIKRLVDELKQRNCLSQEFCFLTKAERERKFKEAIDCFLEEDAHTDEGLLRRQMEPEEGPAAGEEGAAGLPLKGYVVRWDDHTGQRHELTVPTLQDACRETNYLFAHGMAEYVEHERL